MMNKSVTLDLLISLILLKTFKISKQCEMRKQEIWFWHESMPFGMNILRYKDNPHPPKKTGEIRSLYLQGTTNLDGIHKKPKAQVIGKISV